MTETDFINQNKAKWEELESLLSHKTKDADLLQGLFVKVSSDLSYARTYFPNRSVRLYLNQLTQDVFNSMGKKKQGSALDQIVLFFSEILPYEVYRSRKAFIISFLVFSVALIIGIISSANNPEFATVILGEEYIMMTEENIDKGDPMAVYKDKQKVDMFFAITYNNIRVAFLAFVIGLLGSMGTILVLLYNGIMVGVFQYFFYSKGYFLTSFLTIWIHGTIEISAIIIAGAAGMILGNGLLFPKSYNRSSSLQISSRRAIRILLGTVPLFIIAGLMEAFVTRHTSFPVFVKAGIIILSALFIMTLFGIYPWIKSKGTSGEAYADFAIIPFESGIKQYEKYSYKTNSEIIYIAFAQFREFFGHNLRLIVLPATIISSLCFWLLINVQELSLFESQNMAISLYQFQFGGLTVVILLSVILSFSTILYNLHNQRIEMTGSSILYQIKKYPIIVVVSFITVAIYMSLDSWYTHLLSLVFYCQIAIPLVENKYNQQASERQTATDVISESFNRFPSFIMTYAIIISISFLVTILSNSQVVQFLSDFIHWHSFFDVKYISTIFINHITQLIAFLLFLPLIYFTFINQHYSTESKYHATDLKARFESFVINL